MKITIKGRNKEIASLVLQARGRQAKETVDKGEKETGKERYVTVFRNGKVKVEKR